MKKLFCLHIHSVNISIESNVFPDSEKRAIVKPMIKSTLDTQSLSSYRPVSNLSFLSKVMKNVILDQLLEYMLSMNVILDNQSAYRRIYSIETSMCSVINDIGIDGFFIMKY